MSYNDLYFISISCYSVKQMVLDLHLFNLQLDISIMVQNDTLLVEAILQMLHARSSYPRLVA